MSLSEYEVESTAIGYFEALGYTHVPGPELGAGAARVDSREAILDGRLRAALRRINPTLGADLIDQAADALRRLDSPSLPENNRRFQEMVRRGVKLETRIDGELRGVDVFLFDHKDLRNNDWVVSRQFRVKDLGPACIPDLVVFVNGLPLAVFELKKPGDLSATIGKAHREMERYKRDAPRLFATNEVIVLSDGMEARFGSLTAGLERFAPWRSVDGKKDAPKAIPELKVLIQGLFEKGRFLDYIHNFILWESEGAAIKKIAGYHQFFAVNEAVDATALATSKQGDRRAGVVWHTQGSGKSISMVFYIAKLIQRPELDNPTVLVLTDRNDLDGQLFAQLQRAKGLIPPPEQATDRMNLQTLLMVASGGIISATIQLFGTPKGRDYPRLTERRNVVVIADEAHRSQYETVNGFAANIRDGLPNASFIGFTGTPIETDDRSTRNIFGSYIHTYTLSQAVRDGATVGLHYEARMARIRIPEERRPQIDEDFETLTEAEDVSTKDALKTRWAAIEAMVGTDERLDLIAGDLVQHWERRLEILDGKGMIVTMSRRIAVELYQKIVAQRPEWGSEEDAEGAIKVVMTGSRSTDPEHYHPHLRARRELKELERRFKDPKDPLRLVIVRDMWLTGFDAPCAHTLYVDKPMKGHGLMQAIARVNRVFKNKPAGLIVDYIGLAENLRKAVRRYDTPDAEPTVDIHFAYDRLRENVEIVQGMFHGYDYSGYLRGAPPGAPMEAVSGGADYILTRPEGKGRFLGRMVAVNKTAGLAAHLEEARPFRDEIAYFQEVQTNLKKYTPAAKGVPDEGLDMAIKQLVSSAVASEGVVDIFEAAGMERPDLSILSDAFLEGFAESKHKHLQLEMLQKLLGDEIHQMGERNLVQSRRFSEMLERSLNRYQNRSIETAQVVMELIELARAMRDHPKRGMALRLTEDELAFYDALVDHEGVQDVMEDELLAEIAHQLAESIRRSVSLDWTQKETVRAKMRTGIKRILRRKGYPPDKQDSAVALVLKQAETLAADWAEHPPERALTSTLKMVREDWGDESPVEATLMGVIAHFDRYGDAQRILPSEVKSQRPELGEGVIARALTYLSGPNLGVLTFTVGIEEEGAIRELPLRNVRAYLEGGQLFDPKRGTWVERPEDTVVSFRRTPKVDRLVVEAARQ